MASRVGSITQFAPLSPPWQLTQLDQNFTNETAGQNDSSLGYVNAVATDTGTANNYAVTLPFGSPTAYNQGMTVAFNPANANTAGSVITVSPLGSTPILTAGGLPLPANTLLVGVTAYLVFIGSAFRLLNQTSVNPNNFFPPLVSPGTLTIPMLGFSSLNANISQSIAGTYTYNITNLSLGTFVYILIRTSGVNKLVALSASDPSSVAYNINVVYGTSSHIHFGGGATDFAPTILLYQGVATFDTNAAQNVLYLSGAAY
jgi:hypothetical protein